MVRNHRRSLIIILAFITSIGATFSRTEAQSRGMNSEADICAEYRGQVIGHQQGQAVRLTCEMVNAMIAAAPITPPFRDLYVFLRENGHRSYEEAMGPEDARRCRRDRFTLQRSATCEFPFGRIRLHLGPNNQMDVITISLPGERLAQGPLSRFTARYGVQPTEKLREVMLHVLTLTARRGSANGELYSTDGSTVTIELRRY